MRNWIAWKPNASRTRFADPIRGPAGNGPSLRELLDGVPALQAASKPIPGAHSIWELVLHVEAWEREVSLVLATKLYETLDGEADWPAVLETGAQDWRRALEHLESR